MVLGVNVINRSTPVQSWEWDRPFRAPKFNAETKHGQRRLETIGNRLMSTSVLRAAETASSKVAR